MISILSSTRTWHEHGLAFPMWWLRSTKKTSSTSRPAQDNVRVLALDEHFGISIRTQRQRVLRLAHVIEPDRHRMMCWLMNDGIAELNDFTADELLRMGKGAVVESILQAILDGRRD